MSILVECLGIARASNDQNSFLNMINSLVSRMISQAAKKCRIANAFLKILKLEKLGSNI